MLLTINCSYFAIYNFIITYFKFTSNILSFTKIKNIFMVTKSFHDRSIIYKIFVNRFSYNRHIITFTIILTILKRVHCTNKFLFSISLNYKITINISTNKYFIIFSISRHFIMYVPFFSYFFKFIKFFYRNFNNYTVCISRYTMNTFKF